MVQNMMKNKRGITSVLVIVGLVVLVGFAIAGKISLGAITGSGGYIERPVFFYDKCEATSSYKYSTSYTLATNGEWLNKPSVTSYYDVILKAEDLPFAIGGLNFEYYVCNSKVFSESNCRVYSEEVKISRKGETFTIHNVKNNEYVWAQFQKSLTGFDRKAASGGSYQLGFVPYGIRQYNVLGGSGAQINPNSCTYSSTQRDTILSTNADKVNDAYRGVDRSTNERVLQPEEVRWYVAGYLTSAAPSFALRYSGQDAWCRTTGSSGEIYAINEIRTSGWTYKVASADWSDYLGSVTCCPKDTRGDEVCSDDFKWEKIGGSECGIFKSCGSSNWVPYSSEEIIKYKCVDGYCQSETKDVECASDYDCKDSNEVCDLNSWTCADANVNLDGQKIDTIPDNQNDCEARGGTWVKKTSESKSLWNYVGIGEPEVIVEEYCNLDNGFNWTKILIIAIIILVGGYLIYMFAPQLIVFARGLIKR